MRRTSRPSAKLDLPEPLRPTTRVRPGLEGEVEGGFGADAAEALGGEAVEEGAGQDEVSQSLIAQVRSPVDGFPSGTVALASSLSRQVR